MAHKLNGPIAQQLPKASVNQSYQWKHFLSGPSNKIGNKLGKLGNTW